MKTEEFLESYAISDLDVFGRHEEHYSLDNLLNEYARIQIEKDRKAVIENAPLHKRLDIIYAQHNTPISLD